MATAQSTWATSPPVAAHQSTRETTASTVRVVTSPVEPQIQTHTEYLSYRWLHTSLPPQLNVKGSVRTAEPAWKQPTAPSCVCVRLSTSVTSASWTSVSSVEQANVWRRPQGRCPAGEFTAVRGEPGQRLKDDRDSEVWSVWLNIITLCVCVCFCV